MIVMSSRLLCVLAVLLSEALGTVVKFNNTISMQQTQTKHKTLLLNLNRPAQAKKYATDINTVYKDGMCKNCFDCMDRALQAYRMHCHKTSSRNNMLNEIDVNWIDVDGHQIREKRDLADNVASVPESVPKKIKAKKNKVHVTVTKYNVDDEVYALKIKEKISSHTSLPQKADNTSTSCQVYSIKNSFPCNSVDSDNLISKAPKKRVSKKSKKLQDSKQDTDKKVAKAVTMFTKRQADSPHALENVMTSIEDLY